jgi:hypothetical protein
MGNVINEYDWEHWKDILGSPAIRKIEKCNRAGSYEMRQCTAYELENGKFALVDERGCSCYSSDQANIELFPNLGSVIEAMEKWKKENPQSDY